MKPMAFSERIKIIVFFDNKSWGEILLKRFLYYFAWTVALGIVFYFGIQLHDVALERSQSTFNPFFIYLFFALYSIIAGLLMCLPKFFLQMRIDQPWIFDWPVFIAVCIPSLTLVIMTLIPFTPLSGDWMRMFTFLYAAQTTIPTIAGIVFGYALLSCFKKKDYTSLIETF